jgi:Zn-dependent protease
MEPRILVIIGVAVAFAVYFVATGRITRIEIIYFCVLIPSIILHEISHGVVALAFGDRTAQRAGRLSLNPVRHVDLVGTIIVPAVLSLSGYGAFGWAKPVPVNVQQLRHPRNDAIWVSLVGPFTNYLLAAVCGLAYVLAVPADVRVAYANGYGTLGTLGLVLLIAGFANIVLGTFNLLPCPPLDGAALLERMIPAHRLADYYRFQPALMFLPFVLLLLFHNQWSALIQHVVDWWVNLLS